MSAFRLNSGAVRCLPALVFILTFLLVACDPGPLSDLPSTAPVAAISASATASPLHTSTASPTATATQQPPTPSPSAVPSATATPSPVPPTVTPQPTRCTSPGRVEHGALTSVTAGGEQRYNIYLPPCYGADDYVYPVLYLLAGNIHDEHKWVELGVVDAADDAISAARTPPFLIVMPDGGWIANNTSGGPGSYETVILEELLPHVEATYCASAQPALRAIGGLSRGGYWALEIAFRFPELFSSAGGHSAALLDSFAGPNVNPQYTALSSALGDLRIYLDIGAEDYLRTNTIKLHDDMQAAGVAHEWHLNEGQHVDAYWATHVADYLAWYAAPWSHDRATYPLCPTTP